MNSNEKINKNNFTKTKEFNFQTDTRTREITYIPKHEEDVSMFKSMPIPIAIHKTSLNQIEEDKIKNREKIKNEEIIKHSKFKG